MLVWVLQPLGGVCAQLGPAQVMGGAWGVGIPPFNITSHDLSPSEPVRYKPQLPILEFLHQGE